MKKTEIRDMIKEELQNLSEAKTREQIIAGLITSSGMRVSDTDEWDDGKIFFCDFAGGSENASLKTAAKNLQILAKKLSKYDAKIVQHLPTLRIDIRDESE